MNTKTDQNEASKSKWVGATKDEFRNGIAALCGRPTVTDSGKAPSVAGQTRFDTIFEAILAKNILARQGGSAYSKDCLESIERALTLAASLVGKRDNQPQVASVWNQNVI